MTHLERLEYQIDGWLPRRLRDAAMAMDRAEARAVRAPVRLRVKVLKAAGLIDRMARAMLVRVDLTGGCTERDLVEDGFTRSEIATHGAAARDRANQLKRETV